MNLEFYLEKLHNSDEFKDFIKENPDAFLCSGFFVIDKTGQDNKTHLDYFTPPSSSPTTPPEEVDNNQLDEKSIVNDSKKSEASYNERDKLKEKGKIFSFQLEQGIKVIPIEPINDEIPEKVVSNYNFDFDEVETLISDKIEQEGIKNQIQKILLSLQSKDGKCFLIGTVFISALGMLKVNIDLEEMKVTEFEKKSFFDILKRVK